MTIDVCEEAWALPWNAVWTSTKETEDWSAIDQVLTIQGIGWIQRKVGMTITPQDQITILVENGVPVLEVKRLSVASVIGLQIRKYPLDGSTNEVNDKPYGLTKAKMSRKEEPGNVIVLETEAVSGVWKAVSEWSIEEEDGEQFHYRRVNFTSADKQIKVVQKFQRTPQ